MTRRYSEAFERDWAFYVGNRRKFTFFGGTPPDVVHDPGAPSARDCFHAFDSTGRLRPTRHPRLLRAVIVCKKSVNWQVKQWAEGYRDCGIGAEEYLAEFTRPPEWLRVALQNAVRKLGRP